MPKLIWELDHVGDLVSGWITKIPVRAHGRDRVKQGGEYVLRIVPRPPHCDRGNWHLFVDGTGDSRLDFADGWPRYFLGNIDEAKEQMQRWVDKKGGVPIR